MLVLALDSMKGSSGSWTGNRGTGFYERNGELSLPTNTEEIRELKQETYRFDMGSNLCMGQVLSPGSDDTPLPYYFEYGAHQVLPGGEALIENMSHAQCVCVCVCVCV